MLLYIFFSKAQFIPGFRFAVSRVSLKGKKLSNAIAFGIVKAFFIFFGIYAILSLILFAIVKITKPDTSCIRVGGIIDCPNPQGHNISIFGGMPQGMQK